MSSVQEFEQSVSEADIDWILCVELNACPELRSWFGARLFSFPPKHVGAWRSISEPLLGESDLIWLVDGPDGRRHMALIENKITAQAQPEQQERYRLRAEAYRDENRCDEFVTVLVAPKNYRSRDSELYGTRIDYEDLRAWYSDRTDERGAYLAGLYESALHKRSSPVQPDPRITEFRRLIWEQAEQEFPEIHLENPGPSREYWVCQNYGDFWMKYKIFRGSGKFYRAVVDIELPGAAGEVEALQTALGAAARDAIGAEIVEAGKSAAWIGKISPLFDVR